MISSIRVTASKQPAEAAIIFLHGLGDSGNGWAWLPQLMRQTKVVSGIDKINFVFPNAPTIPISVNGGMPMPGWFDIHELGNPNAKQDIEGVFRSVKVLKELIKEQIEKHNVKPEKIIIGGFSQGAAISLATIATLDIKIGALVALSGFCNVRDSLREQVNGANFETPIFQGHGDADPVINYQYGKMTSTFFKELGFKNLLFHTYENVPHSASEEELTDVLKFVQEILKL